MIRSDKPMAVGSRDGSGYTQRVNVFSQKKSVTLNKMEYKLIFKDIRCYSKMKVFIY